MTSIHARPRAVSSHLALAVVAALAGACHKDSSTSGLATSAPSSSQGEATGKPMPIPDAEITKAIKRHFQEETMLRTEHVDVSVAEGIATLSGTAASLLAKDRALAVAESMRGIRSVVDRVTVASIGRTDEQIKDDVTRALRDDLAAHPYAIGVAVSDGRVSLSGTADSWQQSVLFADVAKRVRGVRALENAVIVRSAGIRPDAEISTDVTHRLGNDVWLDGDILSVSVASHVVRLSGVVASVAKKNRARADGWVVGVMGVDDERVLVDARGADDQRNPTAYPLKSDADIADAVREAFRLDPRLKKLVPQVTIISGDVTLRGAVDGPSARGAANDDATNTRGVRSVRNEVVVQAGGLVTDADVARAVKRVLAEDPFLGNGKTLDLSCTNGVVTLKGAIAWGSERFDVISDAWSVAGVREVLDDGLVVQKLPADLKENIEDRMYWDPMVQRDRVSVAVAPGGTATLTGTLDSWGEIKSAALDARWGGATRVINLIKLKDHPDVVAPTP